MAYDIVDIVVPVLVGLTDPFAWIFPVFGAISSRNRWIVIGLGVVGSVIDQVLVKVFVSPGPQAKPFDPVESIGKLIGGALVGLICYGIATWIRRRRQKAASPTT